MTDSLFVLFAVVATGGAIGVVTGRSPVASLLFMVATLASLAGIYVLFEAHFLAAIQVLVYAGAIMVLFLFVIMLLNLGHDYRADLKYGSWFLLSLVVVGLTAGVLVQGLMGTEETGLRGDGAAVAAAIDAAVAEKGGGGRDRRPALHRLGGRLRTHGTAAAGRDRGRGRPRQAPRQRGREVTC